MDPGCSTELHVHGQATGLRPASLRAPLASLARTLGPQWPVRRAGCHCQRGRSQNQKEAKTRPGRRQPPHWRDRRRMLWALRHPACWSPAAIARERSPAAGARECSVSRSSPRVADIAQDGKINGYRQLRPSTVTCYIGRGCPGSSVPFGELPFRFLHKFSPFTPLFTPK
jgi:hypothetical protein